MCSVWVVSFVQGVGEVALDATAALSLLLLRLLSLAGVAIGPVIV